MQPVMECRWIGKHQNALAVNGTDPPLFTEPDRRLRLGSLLHPDPTNPRCRCISYNLFRLGWGNDDHHAICRFRQRAQTRVARVALNDLCVWVDRDDLVPFGLEFLVGRIANLLPLREAPTTANVRWARKSLTAALLAIQLSPCRLPVIAGAVIRFSFSMPRWI